MTSGADSAPVKSILILKSIPMTLQSAEQFLRTRGWVVMSTATPSEAIHLLFENKIDYFLICANHPQKKVKTFPKILSSYHDLRLITFTDLVNTPNMAIIQEMGVPYQVLPPVSGPAIERVIYRIEKEMAQVKNQNNKKNSLLKADNSSVRKLAQENLTKFFENDNDNESEESIPSLESLSLLTNNNIEHSEHIESFAEYAEKSREQTPYSNNSAAPISITSDHSKEQMSSKPRGSTDEFQKGVENVLINSVKSTDSSLPIEKLELAQNGFCFNIESDKFSGFLVVAMGNNRRLDDVILSTIQEKLTHLLKQEGYSLDENIPLEVKIKPVNFENWALEKAEFLKKSIHDGNEVAIAFFPHNKVTPHLEKSETSEMLSINIDDLTIDTPLSFDLYVHLPANNKYILYTPKNGMFLSNQKERLKSKGIYKMHSKKESENEIKKNHIENELNKSIEEFESNSTPSQKKA